MKEIMKKSLGCGFNLRNFQTDTYACVNFHNNRWGPMPGYAHCALRGNGYHDALGGRGARALRFDSTLRRRAADAAPAPTRATS